MFILGLATISRGQVTAIRPGSEVEQQLEQVAARQESTEMADESHWMALEHFQKNPLNLNTADGAQLAEFFFLGPELIERFLQYRQLLGELLSIYELQAVPGWSPEIIHKIRPYVVVESTAGLAVRLKERFRGGAHNLLFRYGQILQPAAGFKSDSVSGSAEYMGSPQRLLFRYAYQYKNLLQYGLLAEKDAGEQFFRGGQKQGFDFYSGHFFVRNLGRIRALALGDFTVNLGQGLIHWQGLAFGKGGEVAAVSRNLPVFRPYQSAGEQVFHRGAGITLGWKRFSVSGFFSFRRLDANRESDSNSVWVTSFLQSGLHRTEAELADRGVQRRLATGGSMNVELRQGRVSLNGLQYFFDLPVRKRPEPYNLYAMAGRRWANYSLSFSRTVKQAHFFGEWAVDFRWNPAWISGLILSVDPKVDLSMVYRNVAEGYQAFEAEAFTESSTPSGEQGIYGGISIRPGAGWRLDSYVDLYRFRWLRYQVDRPVAGVDYMAQLSYRPGKHFELLMRYRSEARPRNLPDQTDAVLHFPLTFKRQSFRSQLNFKWASGFSLRSRLEWTLIQKGGKPTGSGYLIYTDVLYKPLLRPFSAGMRTQYFEISDYDSRIYAFENNVLFSHSIPAFFGTGYRFYLNLSYSPHPKLDCWCRLAHSVFPGVSSVGSGSGKLLGNRQTDLIVQLRYFF